MSAPTKPPRIAPGGRAELGAVTWTIMRVMARRYKATVPNMMLVLARHRRMFFPWLIFASRLMPNGTLPACDSELVILRVGHRYDSEYERHQHTPLARRAGLSDAVIAWTAGPVGGLEIPSPCGSIDSDRALLLANATDELLDSHTLSDDTWAQLSAIYREHQLIEFCMLVGHYAMIAGTLNAAGVPLDAEAGLNNLR
ncbi:MAG: carboxymuconolactone decarboxylase family protein [Solirubrobacteraceae bacterium]|nr:carboxymuconolactone decarboxylase family protein [Solirubrobacteraceae bacterium]